MAIFKCKMCGGTLNIAEGTTTAECEFCGTKQTLPDLSDEKRRNLYDRANHFRRNNDYDKAMSIYEQILNEDKTDAEAYWSIVLCRYGIEYVEDPTTHKHVPTVNRTQFTSVFADEDYKSAIANADGYQKDIYEAEAKEIDRIQKGILAISSREAPYDVFICYKETGNNGQRTPDSVLAQDLYFGLKNEGFNVFFSRITLEDKLGTAYEPYIFAALNSAKVMVVLGTKSEYFNAVWVKNEWSRFLSLIRKGENKTLIPAYKDMDPYDLPDEFSHLQAQDMSKLGFMQDLIRGIKKIVCSEDNSVTVIREPLSINEAPNIAPLIKRAFLFAEDGDFDSAHEYCEKVLDLNPECAEAYVVKLLIDLRLRTPGQLSTCSILFSDNPNYVKAERFAKAEYRSTLEEYHRANVEHIKTEKEKARKELVYNNAIKRVFAEEPDDKAYRTSISELESIIDYKDSKDQIERITQMLEEWTIQKEKEAEEARIYAEQQRLAAEQKRLENERRREQNRIRREKKKQRIKSFLKRASITFAALLLVTIITYFLVNICIDNVKSADLLARNGLILKEKQDYYVVTGVEDFSENIIIPSSYNGKAVKEISSGAFSGSKIKSVEIPDTITKIDDKAFNKCTKLTSVKVPDSVISIGFAAFGECSNLKEITIPFVGAMKGGTSNTHFGYIFGASSYTANRTFVPSSLKTVVITGGENISNYAFYNCANLTSITMPESVTKIGDCAFSHCTGLKSAKIPDGVRELGASAFSDCVSLTGVTIPGGVTRIKSGVFYNCSSLSSLNIPDSIVSIGDYAFYSCANLSRVTIPDSITNIGNSAFEKCTNFTSVEIPNSVTSIGDRVFYGCSSLAEITVNKDNIFFKSVLGNLYSKDGATLIMYAVGKTDTIFNIPDGVTSIVGGAFSGCTSLTSIVIPDSVTSIGSSAFSGCTSLTSIVIGDSVTSMGYRTFYNCTSLTSVTIPDSVKSIGNEAFYNCPIKHATIPTLAIPYVRNSALETVVITSGGSIGNSAFEDCTSLTNIVIGDSVTSIGEAAFRGCTSLTSVEIGDGVTSIGDYLFYGCTSLENIEISDSVTSIGSSAFYGCASLTSIEIPESVTSIGEYSFRGCTSLTNVVIPGSVKSIGDEAFNNCPIKHATIPTLAIPYVRNSSLETVVITSGGSIGNSAFEDCTSLTNIVIGDGVTSIGEAAFRGCTSLTNIVIGDGVTSIGEAAFRGCTSLTSVVIPDSVKSIGDEAFYNCPIKHATIPTLAIRYIKNSSLETVVITSGDSIGSYAFEDCTNLRSVVIGDSVTNINSSAFYGCTSLTRIEVNEDNSVYKSIDGNLYTKDGAALIQYAIGKIDTNFKVLNSVTSIGRGAFRSCTSLTSVEIGDSVTSIGGYAFYNCTSLMSIEIPDSVTSIGDRAFEDCTSLTNIEIPGSVTSIGEATFHNCASLMSIEIPDSVTSIGDYAFKYCTSLTSVVIPDSVKSIGNEAFYNCPIKHATIPTLAIRYIKNSSLETVVITSGDSIGYRAFYGCTSLTSVTIGNSVTSIGSGAFYECTSITNIEIPESVTSIGNEAFHYCYKLVEVINHSYLEITAGSEDNGYVGYYAKEVHTGDSKIYNADGYLFYAFKGLNYLLGYTGCDTKLVLPDNYKGQGYEIYRYAFYDCTSLTNIEIPESVTSIGSSAFCGCTSLTSVVIPDSVTSIGGSTFSGCTSLTSVVIPDSVTSIGSSAFCGCTSLTSVVIPDSVTSIGGSTFSGCTSLTSVVIPDSVKSIGDEAFYGCTSLTSISVDSNNTAYKSVDGNLYTKDGTTLVQYAIGKADISFTVPYSVTSIGDSAFSRCTSLTSVVIADSVTSIGSSAFSRCTSLTSVVIGDSVTSIGYEAFYGCTSLTSIVIPDSVTSIGFLAFSNCYKLVEVINHSTLLITAGSSYYGYVGYYAKEVHTGDSKIDNVDGYLFYTFQDTNYLLGYAGSDTKLVLPENYKGQDYEIYRYAFYECTSLTSVVIGDSVTSIGYYAFRGCTSLTSVEIGDSVTSIGFDAFYRCTSLTSISVDSNNTAYKSIDGNLYTKDGTTLVQYAIGKADISFTVPDSVTSIGWNAFGYCSSLTSIEIPDSVTSIGNSAFYGCASLTSIEIPDSVTSIGPYSFYNCASLTSIVIPDSVTRIGEGAFYYCTNLTSIEIPDSVTSIGFGAFLSCTSITDVYYTGTEEQWMEISIGSDNYNLTGATIHYNYVPEE